MKSTLAKHMHTTSRRFDFIEKSQKIKSDFLSSKIRSIQIEQNKFICAEGRVLVTPNEQISACKTFAQQVEEKNNLIYDSGKSYKL